MFFFFFLIVILTGFIPGSAPRRGGAGGRAGAEAAEARLGPVVTATPRSRPVAPAPPSGPRRGRAQEPDRGGCCDPRPAPSSEQEPGSLVRCPPRLEGRPERWGAGVCVQGAGVRVRLGVSVSRGRGGVASGSLCPEDRGEGCASGSLCPGGASPRALCVQGAGAGGAQTVMRT